MRNENIIDLPYFIRKMEKAIEKEFQIVTLINLQPQSINSISKKLKIDYAMAYRCIYRLKKEGILKIENHGMGNPSIVSIKK